MNSFNFISEESFDEATNGLVSDIIDRLIASRMVLNAERIALEVIQSRPVPDNEFIGFHHQGLYRAVRKNVGRCIRTRVDSDANRANATQLKLAFEPERLQDYYMVKRQFQFIAVPIDELTEFEILSKEKELLRDADSKRDHAKELKAFRRAKFPTKADEVAA